MPVCPFFTIFSRISNGTLATARVVSYFGADSSILTRFLSAWARWGVTRNHKLDILILLFAWLWYLTSNQESVPGWQKYSLCAQVKKWWYLIHILWLPLRIEYNTSACSWRPKNISSKTLSNMKMTVSWTHSRHTCTYFTITSRISWSTFAGIRVVSICYTDSPIQARVVVAWTDCSGTTTTKKNTQLSTSIL